MPSHNDIESALMDMYDLRRAISKKVKNQPKDNEGTDTTIGDCIDAVVEVLENIVMENKNA